MKISVVTTLYRSGPYVREFCERAARAARKFTPNYEIVLVDDGCPADSLRRTLEMRARDKRIRVIELSRNFGQHQALLCGIRHARGDRVFILDCDLEEEPEWLGPFHRKMEEEGCDAVYGIRDRRSGSAFKRLSGYVAWRLFSLLCFPGIGENRATAMYMTRHFAQALLLFPERQVVFLGISLLAGFRQVPLVVHKKARRETSYSLWRRLALFTQIVTSHSNFPLQVIFASGVMILASTLLIVAYLVAQKVFNNMILTGWTSLMVSIWFVGGLLSLFLGIISVYLAAIFLEVKQRPGVIEKRIHGSR